MLPFLLIYVLGLAGVALLGAATGRWPTARGWGALGALSLLVTWHALFVWLAALTEAFLVPWDLTADRPAAGSWSRAVNDFFEAPPGSRLLSCVVVAGSAALFAARMARTADRRWLPWLFAATNLAFIALDLALSLLLSLPLALALPARRSVADLGYARAGPLLALTLALVVMLLLAQARLPGARRVTPRAVRGASAID